MFAGFAPDVPFPVYERDHWWSDRFDGLEYGRDYDFSQPFFAQFRDLMHAVPWPSRSVIRNVNSDYVDQCGDVKNGYLCFNCDICENIAYVIRGVHVRESYDALQVSNCELVYEGVLLDKCFRTFYSSDCESCTDIWFSRDCVGCNNCFGCVGLRKKSYCIWNQQYTKEEYDRKLAEFRLDSRTALAALRGQAARFLESFPVRYYHGIRNVGSSGDMLNDTKNTLQCWWVWNAEDVHYSQGLYLKATDSYDHSIWGNGSSRVYESLTCGEQVADLKFCFDCWPSCRSLEYCVTCHSCSDCFGCVGLQKRQYCIFNKQYSQEDYFALRAQIVAHMDAMPYLARHEGGGRGITYRYGEFFPVEFSPFAYNESMLLDSFPMTKEQAIAEGYRWRDPDVKEFQITCASSALPDRIGDAPDGLAKEIIQCGACSRAYRIVPSELAFLKKNGIALPEQCPDCRHALRFAQVNPPVFAPRACQCAGAAAEKGDYRNAVRHSHGEDHCPNRFTTAYPEDSPNAIYCEPCYNAEIL